MKILLCPDKFKECLSSAHVADYLRRGIIKVFPDAEFRIVPLADGGDGTVDALVEATGGRIENALVHDPLMRLINAQFGIAGEGKTAILEMATASGLTLLKHAERNPLITTTFGTGELIRCALDRGCREIMLGIGGSATVDGGVGMAQALGAIFTDAAGNETGTGGESLGSIYHIDLSRLDARLKACKIYVACDVTNPLTGSEGAAYVFGPQKGAKPAAVKKLNDNLIHLSRVIFDQLQVDVTSLPGGGAAGGLGAGIVAFLNGILMPGFDLISKTVQLEKWIDWADLVITGEGKMDIQTAYGKTPAGVANLASRKGKPLLAYTGSTVDNRDVFHQMGFNAVIPISDGPMTLEKSIKEAGRLLENAGERMARVMKLGKELL